MSYRKIKIAPTREEWLQQRMAGIGGSDAGAVCGLNPYKSAYMLWAEKTGRLEDDFKGNEKTRLGTDLEDYVARRFCEATGKKVRKSNFMFQSVEHPFMLANVDRLIVGENAGLECKTAGQLSDWDFENGEIPPAYYAQCQHYMTVLGAEKWYIAILQFSVGFYCFEIERDQEESEALIDLESAFWEKVQKEEAPEIDGSKSTSDALGRLNPADGSEADGSLIDSNQKTFDLLQEITDQISDLSASKELLRNKIKDLMGKAVKCRNVDFKVSYGPKTNRSCNYAKLQKLFPDAYDECVKTSSSRVLKVEQIKQKSE